MCDYDKLTDEERGSSMPLTKEQAIAEDIEWAFRNSDSFPLTTSEIADSVNGAEPEEVHTVLHLLQERGVIDKRDAFGETLWWIRR